MAWYDVLGGFLTGGISNYVEGQHQEDQFNYNLRLQQQAQYWNERMWRLQNEYNLPSNIMQRLKEGGINPYSVASSLGSAGQASQPHGSGQGSVGLLPQFDFINSFVRMAQVNQDLNLKAQHQENENKTTDAEIAVKDAQRRNILQDTILKTIQGNKGSYELNYFYPEFAKKYQREVTKLDFENKMLSLQSQRQEIENEIRSYWKEHYMMSDMEFDNMIKEYTAKDKKYRYFNFLPIERKIMEYNRDYRQRELFNLGYYGTPTPASIELLGFPIGAFHNMLNNTDYSPVVSMFNAGKQLATHVKDWFKGLFSGGGKNKRNFFSNPLRTTPTGMPYGIY